MAYSSWQSVKVECPFCAGRGVHIFWGDKSKTTYQRIVCHGCRGRGFYKRMKKLEQNGGGDEPE